MGYLYAAGLICVGAAAVYGFHLASKAIKLSERYDATLREYYLRYGALDGEPT